MKHTPRIHRLSRPPQTSVVPKADLRPHHTQLLALLLGPGADGLELPPLTDLLVTLLALSEGSRRKVILPLANSTGEFAFVRRAQQILLSYYDTGPVPQLFVRDRPVELARLIATCCAAALELERLNPAPGAGEGTLALLAERALRTPIKPDDGAPQPTVLKRGGARQGAADTPLSFGFSARIPQGDVLSTESGARADVHALLFSGELWAFVRERRIVLSRGPIFPVIARMVSAARSVVDAWESQRPVHLKLKAGEFGITLRLNREAELSLSLSGVGGDAVSVPAIDVPSALLPILKLASELMRAVVSADRAQSKNLRLSALRDEVRALRRSVRGRTSHKSFMNRDAELLRASSASLPPREREPRPLRPQETSGKLRLSLRWRADVEGLDAGSTFLCGDRLVVATPRSQLALARDDGELLWVRHVPASATLMAATSLLCVGPEGDVELCDVEDGLPYARARIAPRTGGQVLGVFAGGRSLPPVAVLTEGRDRLVALDLRTGEPRWRFRSAGRGNFRFAKAGRILFVVSGDHSLDAIDVASGEVVWRWSDVGRITLAPTVTREWAIAVSGSPGSDAGALLCFDLFSGELRFRRELPSGPMAAPVAAESCAIVATRHQHIPTLTAFDLQTGNPRWQREDPGLGEGGAPLVVDQHLVLNTPSGTAYALDLSHGELGWQQAMADPSRDDVPRRLEPVLRGGALFLPSASVHVLRPSDGSLIGGPIADGIIPDFMRVDERGWLYLAEESGQVEAYAPAPNLRLIKSGGA